jgi:hypothetical protein
MTDLDIILENHKPPTLFSICQSICYTNETPSRIMKLAENSRAEIFRDVEYPLTSKLNKEQFEINIINHFLMRRIGQETLRAFQLTLSNKLNEIMPYYNKLFDMLEGWDIFSDGEEVTRTSENSSTAKATNYSNSTTENTSDRRYSDMPDNRLNDIRSGSYMTDYNYDTNQTGSEDISSGDSSSTSNVIENIKRTPADKLSLYKEFIDNQKSIYTKLYKDLEPCFYGLLD